MVKQLNGIFREWMRVKQADENAPPIIWGYCIVHLSHPEFCGNVLHTSGVLSIAAHKTLLIAETRNNYYALLGPELFMPADGKVDPETFVKAQHAPARQNDVYVNAAMNAERGCPTCQGAGFYRVNDRATAICDLCCKHNQGWWQLEGAYGADNGRWACKLGCGKIVDKPLPVLEFLPRAIT
jgi:hypothetical protein